MASDISVKMAVEGENTFKSALKAANAEVKALEAQLQASADGMDEFTSIMGTAGSKAQTLGSILEAQGQKMSILHQQYESAAAKLNSLGDALDQARSEYGENSAEAQKAANAYNKQAVEVSKLKTQMAQTSTQMAQTGKAMDSLGKDADELTEDLGETGKAASIFGDVLKANLVGDLLKGAGTAIWNGIKAGAEAFKNLTVEAVKSYAAFEQLEGGVKTIFGDDAGAQVVQNAAQAFQTAQISANEYMETVTSFAASLINSLGGDTEEAVSLADMAITDMADNANKMGTEISSLQTAYAGFARSNYTLLDNLKLGFSGSKEGMQDLLDKAEELSGIHFDISSFSDIVQAIHIVQENMGIAGATAEEASTTVEGSVNAMKAAWKNLVTGMGDSNADIDKLLDDFVQTTETAIDNIVPVAERVMTSIGDIVDKLGPIISEKMPGFIAEVTPILANALGQITANLIIDLPYFVKGLWDGVMTAIDTLGSQVPEKVTGPMGEVTTVTDEFGGSIGGATEAVNELTTATGEFGEKGAIVSETLSEDAQAALEAQEAFNELVGNLAELPGYMTDTSYSLTALAANLTATGSSASEFASGVETLRDSVVNGFKVMSEESQISAAEMTNALQENLKTQQQWSTDMHTLWAGTYGENEQIVREYIGHLAEMGPDYAAAVNEMANGGTVELVAQAQAWHDIGTQSAQDYADGVALNAYLAGESGTEVSEAGQDAADAVDYTATGQNKSGEMASGMTGMGQVVTTAAESVAQNAMNAADDVDFSDVGKSAMQDVVGGIISGRSTVATSATGAMENAKAQAEAVDFTSVGLNLARGIASGITAGTGFIQSAAISAVNAAKSAAEAAAGIHSPSTVWRDEVGQMLTKGMAAGMVTSEALGALDDAAGKLAQEGVDRAKTVVQAWEKVYDSYYDTQEHNLFMMKRHGASNQDLITWYKSMQQAVHEQKEHYLAMGVEANSRYIMDLEERWWEYQDEIDDIYEEIGDAAGDSAKKTQEAYEKAMKEIQSAQESMANKLSDFDIWATDKNGNSILSDPREQIALLKEYDRALEDMSKYAGEHLMEDILGMNAAETVDFWHQLQQFGGEKLNEYLAQYETVYKMSEQISEKYYKAQVEALQDEMGLLSDSVAPVMEEVGDLGTDAAVAIADNFAAQEGVITSAMVNTIQNAMNAAQAMVSMVGGGSGVTTDDYYNGLANVVNGLSSSMASQSSGNATVVLEVDGAKLASATIQDFRNVSKANPEVRSA